jgi:hypothetical protein
MRILKVPFKRLLPCTAVDPLVIAVFNVVVKQPVDLIQRKFFSELGEKLTAYGAKEPFNFALSLGAVRPCIAQPDFQRSTSQLEPVRLK